MENAKPPLKNKLVFILWFLVLIPSNTSPINEKINPIKIRKKYFGLIGLLR